VESYRKFTGIPKPQISRFELAPLLEKLIHLETSLIKEKNIKVSITGASISVNADREQMSQVLINLLKNAIEAIEPNNGGEIRIDCTQTEYKTQIDVSNNGNPIPTDILPHIFIPFFTTKNSGSGVGLSVSRYIMRLHGGKLQHSVSAEGWTVFILAKNKKL
jgi:signal transduction histidine kinase